MHLGPVAVEKYGSGGEESFLYEGDTYFRKTKAPQWKGISFFASIKEFCRQVFLPQGYPESVSVDYMEYQIWDTLQALASSVSGTLAQQAVLKGFGVGDGAATVLGATMTWMMKNGAGMIGRILFAWSKGTYLDCDCKRWRLFADILNDASMCLDLIAPNFPLIFTPLVCISGVGLSIVGVAGGATRAALTMHQARRNNMADVSAKDGSQETMSNFIGLLINFAFVYMVTGHQRLIWLSFFMLVVCHLYCNYRAVRAVRMETFNQTRLYYVLYRWFRNGTIASVEQANSWEPLLFPMRKDHTDVQLGCSLEKIMECDRRVMKELLATFDREKYILYFDQKPPNQRVPIYIVLHDKSGDSDHLKALFHAELIELIAAERASSLMGNGDEVMNFIRKRFEPSHDKGNSSVVFLDMVNQMYPVFCSEAQQAGWKLSPGLFGSDEWRCTWSKDK